MPRARRVALGALGLALGLALAEGAFWWRDRGGFPHLNLYEADPALGVRLRPGASQRVSFRSNPVTSVKIGPLGLRGDEPPAPGGVLVLGDSQVFGLGVEQHEAFSQKLGGKLRVPVLNAGVPTYGPAEYQALLERLLPVARPRAVVLTINMANDLFEASRPNPERHAVWDGWAVRKEFAPAEAPPSFPGRALLFRDSHLVYAARGLWHRADPGADEAASEGSYHDLVGLASQPAPARPAAPGSEREQAARRASEAQERLEKLATRAWPAMWKTTKARAYREHHGQPHDIVQTREIRTEASRNPVTTARELLKGAQIRQEIEDEIKRRARKDRSDRGEAVLDALRDRDEARAALRKLDGGAGGDPGVDGPSSPVAPFIEQAQASCQRAGARLVVLVLPLDVQVSPAEIKKYGEEPFDTAPTLRLNHDVVVAALRAGATAVDPVEALREASPGAFLDGDLHMTPRGHLAVAGALAPAVAEALRR